MSDTRDILQKISKDQDILDFTKHKELKADSLESLALGLATSFNLKKENYAVIVPSLFDARTFIDFLSQFVNPEIILDYPTDEVLRIEAISSSKEMLKERLYTLGEILEGEEKHIVVINSISLVHEISPEPRMKESIFTIRKGDVIPPEKLCEHLLKLGYVRVGKVEEVFQFARRGEILDLFTPASPDPYRIEYFDDEIDDIRKFHSADESSYAEAMEILVIPGSENIFNDGEIKAGLARIQKDLDVIVKGNKEKATEDLRARVSLFKDHLSTQGVSENEARYLPYLINSHHCILDYLQDYRTLVYRRTDVEDTVNHYYLDGQEYFSELRKGLLALPRELSCFNPDELKQYHDFEEVRDEKSNISVTDIPYHFSSVNDAPKMMRYFQSEGYHLTLFLTSGKYSRFLEIMKNQGENLGDVLPKCSVVEADLKRGFLLPAYKEIVLTQREIFMAPEGSSYFLRRFREAKLINKYSDLTPGDYVVHEEEGIGIYRGIKEIDGLDYLTIEYAGETHPKLYVPLDKFRMIRKYSSKDGMRPTLDKMGGGTWARRKAKIRGRVSYLADKLLEIAAQRKALPGQSMKGDPELERPFGDAFPFQLTVGQEKALREIYADMEIPHPMDRLLAGDVGFGKTEVAFRAAFRAIVSGKQAALLCPTTVLAKQHFAVAQSRFAGFGVKIAMVSRTVSEKDVKETLRLLSEGKIDFIIGTHRLLSDDVKFKDLGLLIVDEEQRFGVVHKEKIKELYSNIDVLTLTATPIPRTLQMSLLNVRQLSLLSDAPVNRMPIKTYVVKYDKPMVKEVIARELGRNGQVYYLHNRISTIYRKEEELQKMFPHARFGVVHGQLEPDDMAQIMNDFYEHKIDVLVCTTIIETGLDVADCNTIIIEKAEDFGLAQLYQIKGRVGRSSRLAYAYLTYPDSSVLDDDSRKRLKALKSFTELGSGYKIATEDLNIRGAGDILGKEQAGFIDSIGYDAYMKLLQEVMEEKTVQDKAKVPEKKGTKYELAFSLDAHIPASYASEADRINLYRELYDISDMNSLQAFEKKVKDIYGHFPQEMINLFLKKTVEIQLSSPYVKEFHEFMDRYDVRMSRSYSTFPGIGKELSEALDKTDRRIIVPRYIGQTFSLAVMKDSEYLLDLFNALGIVLSLGKKLKVPLLPDD